MRPWPGPGPASRRSHCVLNREARTRIHARAFMSGFRRLHPCLCLPKAGPGRAAGAPTPTPTPTPPCPLPAQNCPAVLPSSTRGRWSGGGVPASWMRAPHAPPSCLPVPPGMTRVSLAFMVFFCPRWVSGVELSRLSPLEKPLPSVWGAHLCPRFLRGWSEEPPTWPWGGRACSHVLPPPHGPHLHRSPPRTLLWAPMTSPWTPFVHCCAPGSLHTVSAQ